MVEFSIRCIQKGVYMLGVYTSLPVWLFSGGRLANSSGHTAQLPGVKPMPFWD